jgi:hypothetical protein
MAPAQHSLQSSEQEVGEECNNEEYPLGFYYTLSNTDIFFLSRRLLERVSFITDPFLPPRIMTFNYIVGSQKMITLFFSMYKQLIKWEDLT